MTTHPLATVSAVVILLAANGFFVAAEFALVKARGFRIDALADDGSRSARLTRRIMNQLEAYLAACQLGITMASLGLGWIGEPAVAAVLKPLFEAGGLPDQWLHSISFLLGFIIFSSLHIVVGEQVPKTFAIRKPEPVSMMCAYPLQGFYLLMYPLNWTLNRASGSVLRWFNVEEATHADVFTNDELRGLINESADHGHIAEDRAAMLANLFAFDERTVGRVMVPRGDVRMLDATSPAENNVAIMRETQHSRFPVSNGETGAPGGMVLAKEIFAAMLGGDDSPWDRLGDFIRPPLYVPESLRIPELFDTMRAERLHMAFVVDEYGDFVGLVTLEDLLEEIVGDIDDETDDQPPEYTITPTEHGWNVHGLVPLGDVHRAVGMETPANLAANTLSGLFMQRLHRMPVVGDSLVEAGFELEVLAIERRHVAAVHIRKTDVTEMQPNPTPSGVREQDSE